MNTDLQLYRSSDAGYSNDDTTRPDLLTLVCTGPYAHPTEGRHVFLSMSDSHLKPSVQVLARRLPGGAVLVHLATNRIFEVNETGAVVWESLASGLTRDEVVARLVETFAVDRDQASTSVERLTAELAREGLLSAS